MLRAPWLCRFCTRSSPRRTLFHFIRQASTASANDRLPQVLLLRARKLSDEHAQIRAALEANFDTTKAKRMGELSSVASALKAWETAKASIQELTVMAESKDEEMRDLAKEELDSTTQELDALSDQLSASLTPTHPFAEMPCLIELRPGPGGMEGRFFADTLLKMYMQFCTRRGYRTRIVSYETVDGPSGSEGENPLQEAVLEVMDTGSYDIFRGETGMHRVQRVPVTESKGRTHTSAVAVWVLPSFPETNAGDETTADVDDPNSDFYIDPAEVRTETMRARGAGGQHVNKTESAIRLTHIPTGTTVSMQDGRSQQRNRETAWKLLRSRIAQMRREQREEQAHSLRSSALSKDKITRGDKIRTYNYTQDRCTDHRSGLDVHNLPNVLEGGAVFDRVIASVQEWQTAKAVRLVIAEEEEAAATAAKCNGKK